MKLSTSLWVLSGALLIGSVFTGCQSSKIAYGNSYYFKQSPREVAPESSTEPEKVLTDVPEEPLLVSAEPKSQPHQTTEARITEAEQKIVNQSAPRETGVQNRIEKITEMAASARSSSLDRREKREKRQEIRREIKALSRELKASPQASSELSDLDPNLRKAIIFGGIGLVLSIIGSVTLTPAIWVLASIAWLAGSVFFIIWLVEELG